MSRTLYVVTDTAPETVNGTKVKPGHLLWLTEPEALYERDLGFLEATTVAALAQELDLTDDECAALPYLDPDAPEGEAVLGSATAIEAPAADPVE